MVGGKPLRGKDAIRKMMAADGSPTPPAFTVDTIVAEGDVVACVGDMTMAEGGKVTPYSYCDVWRFRDGKPVSLKAFVIKTEGSVTVASVAIVRFGYRPFRKQRICAVSVNPRA